MEIDSKIQEAVFLAGKVCMVKGLGFHRAKGLDLGLEFRVCGPDGNRH